MDEFQNIVTDASLGVRWIISLREAYSAKLELLSSNVSNNTFELLELKAQEVTEVIVEPAAQKGVEYEDGLIPQILSDLESVELSSPNMDARGWFAPSPIQWICYTLFEEREADETVITHDLYSKERGPHKLSGAPGVLSSYLQRVLKPLSTEDRELAIRILRIVRDPLEEEAVTSGLKSFVQAILIRLGLMDDSIEAQQVRTMLNRLIDSRLLTLGYRETASGQKLAYGLVHDSLTQAVEEVR